MCIEIGEDASILRLYELHIKERFYVGVFSIRSQQVEPFPEMCRQNCNVKQTPNGHKYGELVAVLRTKANSLRA